MDVQRGLDRRGVAVGVAFALWLGAAAAEGGFFAERGLTLAPRVAEAFSAPGAEVLVLDGDTFEVAGRRVRLLSVDTPEKGAPWFDGDQEPWASRASDVARAHLRRARRVTVVLAPGAEDAYGRSLGHLFLDGQSLALTLAQAGLAYPTVDRYGHGGFPDLAERILLEARPPPFEPPWVWRRRHRVEPP